MSNQPANSQEKRVKVRLAPESFSDIIFGLALSIGSLILIQNPVSKWQDFSWNVLLFGFSFIVIAMIWLLFSGTICYLSTDSSSVLFLNLVLFFCVALEPYLFYLIMNKAFQGLQSVTSVAYALDVGAMFLVLGTFYFSDSAS